MYIVCIIPRYYCYRRGQRFGQHVDTCVRHSNGDVSEYTLLIYLNGQDHSQREDEATKSQSQSQSQSQAQAVQLRGGETVFYATAKRELCSVAPVAGTLRATKVIRAIRVITISEEGV